MSTESLKTLFEIIGVFLLGLTFIDGGLVWYFSRQVNEQQTEKLREFDKDLTDAKTELAKQQQLAAAAEHGITDAKKSAADAMRDAGLANQRAGEANERAEELRKRNLELEEAIAPRIIAQSPAGVKLNEFAGVKATVLTPRDVEAYRTGAEIMAKLVSAQWNATGPIRVSDDEGATFFEGVTIETVLNIEGRTRTAAEKLAGFLEENHIETRLFPASDKVPSDSMVIKVGLRPTAFFINKRLEELRLREKSTPPGKPQK